MVLPGRSEYPADLEGVIGLAVRHGKVEDGELSRCRALLLPMSRPLVPAAAEAVEGGSVRTRAPLVSRGVVQIRDPGRSRSDGGRRRASGIYGTIVTAAVIAAGGNQLTTAALAVTIVVTLLVYWLAEQYAELLGEHTHRGQLPNAGQVRASLGAAWPMVTASAVPVGTLLVAYLLGASSVGAARIALIVTAALLVLHGYAAGRAAGLVGARLVAVTGMAGVLGAAMVVLKAFLQHHHH